MLRMDIVPMVELFRSRYSAFRRLRHTASSISAASKCLTTIAVRALKKLHEASNNFFSTACSLCKTASTRALALFKALDTLPTHQGLRSSKENPTIEMINQPAGNPMLWSRAGKSET